MDDKEVLGLDQEMSQALVHSPALPAALMRKATDVAGLARKVVLSTAVTIQGRKYVKVEGWMTIASLFGLTPSIESVTIEDHGISSIASLRLPDGRILSKAEGFVGDDEVSQKGKDGKMKEGWADRKMFARRAMAQTRALSRVCRSVLAFVVTLIDSNLSTTPAEEMDVTPPNYHAPDAPGPQRLAATQTSPRSAPAPTPSELDRIEDAEWVRGAGLKEAEASVALDHDPEMRTQSFEGNRININVPAKWGKYEGQPISQLPIKELERLLGLFEKAAADPAKSSFLENNLLMVKALRAEIAYLQSQFKE